MKIKVIIVLITISVICCHNFTAQEHKNIAITFDDLPTLSHDMLDSTQQIQYFERIISVLEKYNIVATGFIVGKLIKPFNAKLITKFIENGHSIGNHTYSHFDLNKISYSKFQTDIEINDNLLSDYNYQNMAKYFRYPMLHRGDCKSKRDSISNYLLENNFIVVPVTIDTDEPKYNIEFVTAFFNGDSVKMKKIGKKYLEHMIEKSQYYADLGYKIGNRNINHILLLHMNFINSFFLDELLNWYKLNNWNFISLEESLSDSIYKYEDKYFGRKGLSWLERISYDNRNNGF